jgi:hypothetical protein
MAQEHTIAKDLLTRKPTAAIVLQILAPRGEEPMTGAALADAVSARTDKAPFSAMYTLKMYSPALVTDILDDRGRPQDRFICTPLGRKVGDVLWKLRDDDAPPPENPEPAKKKAAKKATKKKPGRPRGSKNAPQEPAAGGE